MPNNPTIKGDNTVLWGTGGVYDGEGIVTGAEKGTGADKLEVADENGFTVCVIYFNHNNECSFEMIVKTAAPDLEIGDFIELCGVADCIVEDTRQMWANKDVRKFSVKAKRYQAITAPVGP